MIQEREATPEDKSERNNLSLWKLLLPPRSRMQRMAGRKGGVTSFTKVDVTLQRKDSIEKPEPELLTRRSITYWQLLSNKRGHLGGEIVNSISYKRPTLSHPFPNPYFSKNGIILSRDEEHFPRYFCSNERVWFLFFSFFVTWIY